MTTGQERAAARLRQKLAAQKPIPDGPPRRQQKRRVALAARKARERHAEKVARKAYLDAWRNAMAEPNV